MSELGRGQLVGAQDRDHLLDARVGLEAEALHVLAVADGADHRDLLAARRVRAGAHALDTGYDGLDVLLGRRRLHDYHHLACSWKGLAAGNGTTRESSGARPFGPGAGGAVSTP